MILRIDYDLWSKVRSDIQYVFDLDTYLICEKNSDDEDFMTNPISFPKVNYNEAMNLYVKSINNPKAGSMFAGLSEEECKNWFWWQHYDSIENSDETRFFITRFLLQTIVNWCEENNVAYYIDRNDKYLKNVLGE